MKRYWLLSILFLGSMTISCHCTNPDFNEFEGEYHDNRNDNTPKEEKKVETLIEKEKALDVPEVTYTPRQSLSDSKIIGTPEIDRAEQSVLLKRTGYILLYNRALLIPDWVFWHLTAEHTDGEYARDNYYYEDEDIGLPRAQNEDYKDSGWTRGHMCPAGDNKWDEIAMKESNLLTNICPQHTSLNSGLWNVIERNCRKWAQTYGDLYIVCGPVLLNKEHETIGKNKVVVPEAFFKVILRLNPKPAAIGFVVKNNEGKKKKDQYVNTVDEVERITGIDFFPALPDDIENEVEAYANLDDWR